MTGHDERASQPPPARVARRTSRTPLQQALGLLTRREHSCKDLVSKLVARGVGEQEANLAVERLRSNGWQDDARFAQALLHTRVNAGYGPIRIRAELEMHALDNDLITTVMDTYDGDWSDNAGRLIYRRFGIKIIHDPHLSNKAAAFLFRRGFSRDHIRSAIQATPEQE